MISFSSLLTTITYITLPEIVDIGLVAFGLYIVLLFIKQTKSYFLAGVIVFMIAIHFISQNLNLTLTRSIIQPAYTFIFIMIAIVFQRDLRRFFKWIVIGQLDLFTTTKQISKGSSAEIAEALLHMAENKIGAIIVFPRRQDIDDITEGGQHLGGDITKEILLSIFDDSSAGHDGAVIIEGNVIKQFGVHLPLARTFDQYKKTGTRHRAGAGITEDTDAIAFAVSEERGTISMFIEGKMKVIKEIELREVLKELTGEVEIKNSNFWHFFFVRNLGTKICALVLAFTVWTVFYAQVGIIKKEYTVPLSFRLLPQNLEVDAETGKKLIKIIVEGTSSDINSLASDKIEVRIDAQNFATGTQKITLTDDMISLPSFIHVSEVNPKTVSVVIKEKDVEVK